MTDDESPGRGQSAADALVEALAAGGAAPQEGAFTLDRAVALEKLARFQLAEPRSFVLELVQAALCKGATRVAFAIDSDDVRFECDGRPFNVADLEGLYEAALSSARSPDEEARRQLAIALQAVTRLEPRFVRLTSGEGSRAAFLERDADGAERVGAREEQAPGTRLHVRYRHRLKDAARIVQNIGWSLPEEVILRERCRFARADITLEGRPIARQPFAPGALFTLPLEGPFAWGEVALDPALPDRRLILLWNGVWIATRTWPTSSDAPRGFVAIVEAPELQKDLSQRDVVKDQAYRKILAAVERGFDQAARIAWLRMTSLPVLPPDLVTALERARCFDVARTAEEPPRLLLGSGDHGLLVPSGSEHCHRFDGQTWSRFLPPPIGFPVAAVHARAGGDVLIVSSAGEVAQLGREAWTQLTAPNFASVPTVPLAAEETSGASSPVTPIDFTTDSPSPEAPGEREPTWAPLPGKPSGICSTDDGHLFVTLSQGGLLRFDGSRWTREPLTDLRLTGVWARSATDVHVVGERGLVFHYDGTAWRQLPTGFSTSSWSAIWGASEEAVFAVGSREVRLRSGGNVRIHEGTVIRWGGQGWQEIPLPAPESNDEITRHTGALKTIWGTGPRDVFVAGSRGTILHFDGDAWSHMDSGTGADLRALWGTGPRDVYALGDARTLIHYDGASWGAVPPDLVLDQDRISATGLRSMTRIYPTLLHAEALSPELERRLQTMRLGLPLMCLLGALSVDDRERLSKALERPIIPL